MLLDQDCMNLIGVFAADLRKKMIKVEMVNNYNLTYVREKHYCKQLSNILFRCTCFVLGG